MIALILVFIYSGTCTTTSPSQCYTISWNPEASVTGEELLICMYLLHRDLALPGRYKNHYNFTLSLIWITLFISHFRKSFHCYKNSSHDCPSLTSYNLGKKKKLWEFYPSQGVLLITAEDAMGFTLPSDPPWGTEKMKLQFNVVLREGREGEDFSFDPLNCVSWNEIWAWQFFSAILPRIVEC